METENSFPNDYKIGYSGFISLVGYEGQLIWSVFSNLLAVNTFIVAFNIAMIKLFTTFEFFVFITSGLGLVLCWIWWTTTNRMFGYYKFWFTCLRDCESKLFQTDQGYFEKGKQYGEGNTVSIGKNEIRMNGLNRLITNKMMIKTIIIIVSLLYVGTVFVAIYNIH